MMKPPWDADRPQGRDSLALLLVVAFDQLHVLTFLATAAASLEPLARSKPARNVTAGNMDYPFTTRASDPRKTQHSLHLPSPQMLTPSPLLLLPVKKLS